MKIGFSSLVCPGWNLETIVSKASEYGFDGIELRGIEGDLDLPAIAELSGNPGATKQMFERADVELVSLASSCTMDSRDAVKLARNRLELESFIETASRLGCPYVRMFAGEVQRGETRGDTLSRVGQELSKMAPVAAQNRVTILVSNSGDFLGSSDLWYLCDCVSHPAVRACWNPCSAMTLLERPTVSIPRLGATLGVVHVCDGRFDEQGYLDGYTVPGEGDVGVGRMIELLKGVFFNDYLMFEWPKLWDSSLAGADEILPKVSAYLRGKIAEEQVILTAYKGKDKKGPAYKALPSRSPARPM